MNLKPVPEGTGSFFVCCVKCNSTGRAEEMFADLEGSPFTDFYCAKCAFNECDKEDPKC